MHLKEQNYKPRRKNNPGYGTAVLLYNVYYILTVIFV